jgi:hypothetical protein
MSARLALSFTSLIVVLVGCSGAPRYAPPIQNMSIREQILSPLFSSIGFGLIHDAGLPTCIVTNTTRITYVDGSSGLKVYCGSAQSYSFRHDFDTDPMWAYTKDDGWDRCDPAPNVHTLPVCRNAPANSNYNNDRPGR